jgi:hypothetical protein
MDWLAKSSKNDIDLQWVNVIAITRFSSLLSQAISLNGRLNAN